MRKKHETRATIFLRRIYFACKNEEIDEISGKSEAGEGGVTLHIYPFSPSSFA